MPESVFSYPGAKYYHANWIIDHLPNHHCYVEPFGGSASVLVSKPKSSVEVYNDLDGDLVQFFETLRDNGDELRDWLRSVPFSRDLHNQWSKEFYQGLRPTDDIERAGRFFYLRYSQFAGKYTGVSGFSSAQRRNPAEKFKNAVEDLDKFANRLRNVQVENLDHSEVLDRFDDEDTVFYCDPPYVDEGDDLYSHAGEFDHKRFVQALEDLEGKWMVSYTRLPEGLRSGYYVAEKDVPVRMRQGQGDWEKTNKERLVMNFDPQDSPMFVDDAQKQLTEVA